MFFDVTHTPTVSRTLTHEKLEIQRKQLPAWYPQPVWEEIESAIDGIDLPSVALPIYRKYLSEDLAEHVIKFLATKPGQDAIEVVIEREILAQHSGVTPTESRREALNYLWNDRNGVQTKILGEMTPEQRRKAESLGAEYVRMQPLIAEMQKEYSQAIMAKQTELAKAIAQKHQDEIIQGRTKYESEHSQDQKSDAPESYPSAH